MSRYRLRALLLSVFLASPLAQAAVPTLSLPAATPAADGAATLQVTVDTDNKATTVNFNYGRTTSYGTTSTASVAAATTAQTATVNLTGLIGGQTYHFQITASNSDGSATPTTDATFTTPAYLPTLTLLAPTHAGGIETVHAQITANGSTGTVFFQYGTDTSYGATGGATALAATDVNKTVDYALPAAVIYHYRLVYDDGSSGTPEAVTPDDLSNDPPVAANDVAKIADIGPVTITVLDNDTDANADDILVINSVRAPKNGTATTDGNTIEYTPGPNFRLNTVDTFTYTIDDDYGGTATATVTVQSLIRSLAGTHGGVVMRSNGREIGYFTLTTTASGGFTGILIVDGERYVVTGFLAPDGSYSGYAVGKHGVIPVSFTTTIGDAGSTIAASFGNGTYTASLSIGDDEATTRIDLTGRYTVGLASGGSSATTGSGNDAGNEPEGTGWLALRVRQDGTASIKGRLPDGRSFSTKGTVDIIDGTATLSFYDDPKATRVIGVLTLGTTVGGTVRTDRQSSGGGDYPRGFDVSQAASGAPYSPPKDGRRALDTTTSKGQDLTIDFSGAGLSSAISRQLFLNDRDKVTVVDRSTEELKVKIDRKSGRFQAKITVDNDGKRIKATGVLIQATDGGTGGNGVGIFELSGRTGKVTISGGGSGTTPTPTPEPTPEPEPTDPTTEVPADTTL